MKPFVKRQKNDQADTEAITEAASRSTMRLVAIKSEAKQALGMAFKTRDLFVHRATFRANTNGDFDGSIWGILQAMEAVENMW